MWGTPRFYDSGLTGSAAALYGPPVWSATEPLGLATCPRLAQNVGVAVLVDRYDLADFTAGARRLRTREDSENQVQ